MPGVFHMRALPSPASPRVERVKTDFHTLLLPLIAIPYAFVKGQHLRIHLVFLQLPSYVSGYLRLVLSHSIHIVPPAPELPIPIPVFHPLPALIYHQAAFPLDISHYPSNTVLRRYRQQHMYVVRTYLRLYYLHTFPLAQLP